MKTIAIASRNPVKVNAALRGFTQMFPGEDFSGVSVDAHSEVSAQPFSSEETLAGAMNRANQARQMAPDADYWVGIEGGVEEHAAELGAFAWVVVQSSSQLGKGRTGTFYLPPLVAKLVRDGLELGQADDLIFHRSNSKQENGAIGLLTGDCLDRTSLYETAVIFALIPFRNPDLYS